MFQNTSNCQNLNYLEFFKTKTSLSKVAGHSILTYCYWEFINLRPNFFVVYIFHYNNLYFKTFVCMNSSFLIAEFNIISIKIQKSIVFSMCSF